MAMEVKEEEAGNQGDYYSLLKEITGLMADAHLSQGKGVVAAAMLLSVKDLEGAAMKLLRTNELHHVYVLTQLFDVSCGEEVLIRIAESAIGIENNKLARIFLDKMKKSNEKKMITLGSVGLSLKEIGGGLKSLEEYKSQAKELLGKFNYFGGVFNHVMARNHEESFKIAIEFAKSSKKPRNQCF